MAIRLLSVLCLLLANTPALFAAIPEGKDVMEKELARELFGDDVPPQKVIREQKPAHIQRLLETCPGKVEEGEVDITFTIVGSDDGGSESSEVEDLITDVVNRVLADFTPSPETGIDFMQGTLFGERRHLSYGAGANQYISTFFFQNWGSYFCRFCLKDDLDRRKNLRRGRALQEGDLLSSVDIRLLEAEMALKCSEALDEIPIGVVAPTIGTHAVCAASVTPHHV